MARSGVPGNGTVSRLAGRMDRAQLTRVSMPGGGEVFKGPAASRALKAMGARAMTVDRSIIVGDSFNASRAEDQALFAHEEVHRDYQGSSGGHSSTSTEEKMARQAEAMVFHRMAGGYEGGYGPGGNDRSSGSAWSDGSQNSQNQTPSTQGSSDKPEANAGSPSPSRGYAALRAQGYNHGDVVEELTRRAMGALQEQDQVKQDRGEHKSWT